MQERSFTAKIRELFSAHDMTQGAPWKRILEFAVPMLIGNLAQQLYNTADSIIVGRYVGDNALAAVGSASPILNLLLALFVGVSTGVGILVAQRFGAKDREQLSVVIGNCISLSAIVSLVTMLIGLFITRPMLALLRTLFGVSLRLMLPAGCRRAERRAGSVVCGRAEHGRGRRSAGNGAGADGFCPAVPVENDAHARYF